MLCMYGSRCSLKMTQDDRIWQSYMQCGMMLWHLLTSSLFTLFLCLKAYSFLWPQCEMHKPRYQLCICGNNLCDTRDDTNICTTMIWYVCYENVQYSNGTSHVAGNIQMASLNRQVMQNGLGVNNAIAREYAMVSSRLPSFEMMSGGVLDVDAKMMETRP